MDKRKSITAIVSFVLLAIVVTLVVDTENTVSQNGDMIEHDYTFTGASEHWSAVLNVNGKEVFYEEQEVLQRDSEAQSDFTLTYQGPLEDLASVAEMRYTYQTPHSSTEVGLDFTDVSPGDTVFTDTSNNLVRENATIGVTVEWGDHTEKFSLEAAE
ncbi:hypothetical protein [Lentibacillus salinarum]|uniref:Uncharacterized protein n=1 Tax=Lentibacillus salinarum TaxID=446820 RepID=A0ABW3ZTM9_9BACI